LSTKLHATVDALGNPTNFPMTLGQAHDLCGADKLIPTLEANILLADKAYDAAERVIDVLQNAGKKSVIPSKSSSLEPRVHDRELYKA
jgi:transposase